MKFCLYIITFPNNKKYVGITTNFLSRKNKHKNRAKKSKYQHLKLYRAINKYGFNNLKWEFYTNYHTWKDLSKAEIDMIFKLNSMKLGYNTTNGGEGHLGFKPSKETKEKISKSNKNRPKPLGFKEHLSKIRLGVNNPMYGATTSKKQKEAVSKASKGEKNVNSKLTNKQINEIRNKYKSGKYLIQELAKNYNINRNAISKIIQNKSYIDSKYITIKLEGNNKLIFNQAEKIRKLYKTNNHTQKEIAKMFNVCVHTIFRIIHNKTYKP